MRCRGEEAFHRGRWVKDGEVVFFDTEGRETHRGTYRLGVEHGSWRERSEDGSIGAGEYRDGAREGPWRYAYPGGARQEEGSYVRGERDGRWTRWYEDGRVAAEVHWKAGVQSGPASYWRRDGSLDAARSGEYVEGAKVR